MLKTIDSQFYRRAAASVLVLSCIAFVGWDVLHDDGVVGATRKNGFGCTCHSFQASESVRVWIEGPARVRPGSVTSYEIVMTGGPAMVGGYNVAAGHGGLAPADTGSKTMLSVDGTELTHTRVRAFAMDTVRWAFLYTAPADTTLDTLYAVGNSADGNGNPTGDEWSDAPEFVVDLTDSVSSVDEPNGPRSYALLANYPNPFNPSTMVRFTLAHETRGELAVFDLRGERVATLLSGRIPAGETAVRWDAAGRPSGIYVARLSSADGVAAVKMLLLR